MVYLLSFINMQAKNSRHFSAQSSTISDCGEYPLQWSEGLITALHKKGDPSDPDNYRKITVNVVMGKVFDSILNARLYYKNEALILDDTYQFGFTFVLNHNVTTSRARQAGSRPRRAHTNSHSGICDYDIPTVRFWMIYGSNEWDMRPQGEAKRHPAAAGSQLTALLCSICGSIPHFFRLDHPAAGWSIRKESSDM